MLFFRYLFPALLILSEDCLSENLLKNTSFREARTTAGVSLMHWQYDGWNLDPEQAFFRASITQERSHLIIEHKKPTHSYLYQTVNLKPDTIYRFSARVKTLGTNPLQIAAAIGVVGRGEAAASVPKRSNWHGLNLYIQNNEKPMQVLLMLSFGHYSNLNQGTALFDRVYFETVSRIPNGATQIVYGKPKVVIPAFYYWPPENRNTLGAILALVSFLCLFALWCTKRSTRAPNMHQSSSLDSASENGPDTNE